jgi:hypothetical protein
VPKSIRRNAFAGAFEARMLMRRICVPRVVDARWVLSVGAAALTHLAALGCSTIRSASTLGSRGGEGHEQRQRCREAWNANC